MGANEGSRVMKLNVLERLICNGLLPAEANFATLKLMRKAREALSFTDEQNEALNFEDGVSPDGKPTSKWSQKAAKDIGEQDIKLGVTPTKAIIKALKDLEDQDNKETGEKGMLKPEHESLYEKFVEGDPLADIESSSKIIPLREVASEKVDETPAPEESKE